MAIFMDSVLEEYKFDGKFSSVLYALYFYQLKQPQRVRYTTFIQLLASPSPPPPPPVDETKDQKQFASHGKAICDGGAGKHREGGCLVTQPTNDPPGHPKSDPKDSSSASERQVAILRTPNCAIHTVSLLCLNLHMLIILYIDIPSHYPSLYQHTSYSDKYICAKGSHYFRKVGIYVYTYILCGLYASVEPPNKGCF